MGIVGIVGWGCGHEVNGVCAEAEAKIAGDRSVINNLMSYL